MRRELKASDGDMETGAKRKKHEERSDSTRTSRFVQQVQDIVGQDPSKSMRAFAKDLNVLKGLTRHVIHEVLQHKSL